MKTAATAAAAFPILNAEPHQHASSSAPAAVYKPKWATAEEMKLLAALADLIIPRTETPGASDAKVHEYIDYVLAGNGIRGGIVREALPSYADPVTRLATLEKASTSPRNSLAYRFFQILKDLTIDGYYQSREGLVQELGWSGNTFLPEFKGCTHPEHKG